MFNLFYILLYFKYNTIYQDLEKQRIQKINELCIRAFRTSKFEKNVILFIHL